MLDNAAALFSTLTWLYLDAFIFSFNMVRSFKDSPIDSVLWLQSYKLDLCQLSKSSQWKGIMQIPPLLLFQEKKASSMQSLEYWKSQPSFLYGCVCLRAMLLVLTVDPPR